MIDQAEARTRVLRVLDADCEENVGTKRRTLIADKIIAALYAPRTRLREVVAPSGDIYRVRDTVVERKVWLTSPTPTERYAWVPMSMVETTSCAVVADLQARPTEEVPSEEPGEVPERIHQAIKSLSKAWSVLNEHASHIDGEFDHALRDVKSYIFRGVHP